MITVITEHAGLIAAKVKVVAHPHLQHVPEVIDALNRALGDTGAQLRTAIDGLDDPAMRMHAQHALQAITRHAGFVTHLDAVLEGIALLPADVDVDYEATRLRAERETTAADLTRNIAVLVHTLADVAEDRTDAPTEGASA